MTTFKEAKVCCACCDNVSTQSILSSSNEFGSRDLDQRPAEMMRSTMDSWLQECSDCGYIAAKLEVADEHDRRFVRTAEYRSLRDRDDLSSLARRFLLRAAIEQNKDNAEGAFEQTLRAAWVADDGNQPETATAFRRLARQYLTGGVDQPIDLQLVGLDVLRRAALWQEAAALAARLDAQKLEHPLSAIVRFHSGKIAAEDDSRYTIEDALSSAPIELPEGYREIPIIFEGE